MKKIRLQHLLILLLAFALLAFTGNALATSASTPKVTLTINAPESITYGEKPEITVSVVPEGGADESSVQYEVSLQGGDINSNRNPVNTYYIKVTTTGPEGYTIEVANNNKELKVNPRQISPVLSFADGTPDTIQYGDLAPTPSITWNDTIAEEDLNKTVEYVIPKATSLESVTVKATIPENNNFTFTAGREFSKTFQVTTRKVILRVESASKEYDGQVPPESFNAQWNDDVAISELGSQYSLTLQAPAPDANEYTFNLTVSAPNSEYFTWSVEPSVYTINPVTVSPVINLSAQSVEYGGNKPTATLSWSRTEDYIINQIEPQTPQGDIVIPEVGSIAESGDKREVSVTVTNTSNSNVIISKTANITYTVTRRSATVAANNASKVYGGTDPELTATVTGEVNGDKIVYSLAREAGDDARDYDINVNCNPDEGVNRNYSITTQAGKFTITPAGGYSVIVHAPTRDYNGKVPALTDEGVSYEWSPSQPAGMACALKFVDTPAAGIGSYTISADITGTNYAVEVRDAEYVINPLEVTLKMPSDHKTYDGKEADVSKLKGEWSSDLAKDIVYTPTVEKNKNAGSYAIGATVAENGNFTVTVEKGTYTINPKPATITPNEKTKTYGDPDPAFDATVTGVLAGEKLNYTLGRDVKSENVGKYSIKVTYDKTDAVNRNYEITTSSKNLNIVQRPVTLTVEDKPKVYGDKDPEFTVTTDNMAKGETLAYTISRKDGEKVGTYTIDATLDENAAVNKNYKITVKSGTLTISKRPVTLTAATLSKIYGEKDPALTASADNMAFTDQLQYTVKRATGENVGDYDITIELPKTAVEPNNNYTITTKAAKLTINQRPVKLTAEAKTKVYGDKDPELTATTDNMANGEKLVYTLSRVEGEKVGTYTITATPDTKAAVNKNYAITPVTGVLTVTKRPVTLTATALSKIYGEKDPTLTATPDNMAFTDKLAYTLKRAEGENVGDYTITIELPKAATEPNNNYDIKLVAAKLTINQRPVNLTVEAKTKIYGEKDPEFTATTDNMANGEKLVYTLSRTEGEKVGKYTITATPDAEAAVNKNYAITPVANTLTIDPLAIKLTVAESAKFYGQKDPTFTASAPTVYDDVLQYTFERDEGEAVGTYEVRVVPTADVEPNSNYTITPVAAKLTVSYLPHADAVISAPDENGWYNVKSGPITITAPEGYEISKTYDEGFGPSIVFEDSKVLETAKYTYVLRSVKTDGTADGQTEIVTGEYRQDTVPPTEFTVNNSSSVRFVPADNENGSGIVRSEYVQFKSSSEEVVDGRVLYQSTNLDEVRFQHPYAGGFRVVQWDAAGNCTVSNYITLPDSDGDRLNDYFEQDFKSDPKKQDTDGDGLNDSEEYTRGCNPNSSDSDGDGLTDGEEVSKGLNPTRTDTDSDGIPDGTAYLYEGKDADLSMGAEMVLGRGYSTETAVTTAEVPEVLEQYAMYGFIEEHASAELTGAQATRSVGNKVKPVVYMNRASGHVITLTGDILSVYVQNNYRFNAETTLQLNYLAEGETATALVSNDGQVAAIAKWENGVAAEDILLVDIAAGKTYLVSDSAGATLFDLRADGAELAYVKDGQLTTLTLGKEDDMHVQAYSGNALQYLEDGSLAVNINVESWKADVLANGQMKTVDFSGYYYLGNRALGSVQLIMRAEGQNVEIEMSGNVVLSSQDTLIRFVNSEQKYKALITANQFTK